MTRLKKWLFWITMFFLLAMTQGIMRNVLADVICRLEYNPLSGRNEMTCTEDGKTTVCEEVYNPLNDTWELRCKEK